MKSLALCLALCAYSACSLVANMPGGSSPVANNQPVHQKPTGNNSEAPVPQDSDLAQHTLQRRSLGSSSSDLAQHTLQRRSLGSSSSALWDVQVRENGDIFASGPTLNSAGGTDGWVIGLNELGEALWEPQAGLMLKLAGIKRGRIQG